LSHNFTKKIELRDLLLYTLGYKKEPRGGE